MPMTSMCTGVRRLSMLTIRPATLDDLPGILEVYNDAILHTTAVYQYRPHTLAMRTAWYMEKRSEGFPVFVADEDGAIVGFSALGHFRTAPAYHYAVENTVYVASSHRRKGIGQALMGPVIAAARQMDKHAILAGVDARNTASIALHLALGFVEVAHFKQVGYKFGTWLDLKFFELLLDTPANPVEFGT